MHRFGIAHGEQRADRRSLFLNEIERHLNPPAIGSFEFVLPQRPLLLECRQKHRAQNRAIGKNFFRGAPQNFAPRAAEKLLRRGAYQHHPRIAREQHEPVLQLGHDLLDVVFQRGKNLVGIANLPAQVSDLQRHQAHLVLRPGLLRGQQISGAGAVEVAADGLQRSERDIRNHRRQHQRTENRDHRKKSCLLQFRSKFVAQKNRRDAHANAAKGLAVELQPDAHVINRAGAVEQAQLAPEARVAQHRQTGALGNRLAIQSRIGIENRHAMRIDDGGVVDDARISHHRFQHVVQVGIGLRDNSRWRRASPWDFRCQSACWSDRAPLWRRRTRVGW